MSPCQLYVHLKHNSNGVRGIAHTTFSSRPTLLGGLITSATTYLFRTERSVRPEAPFKKFSAFHVVIYKYVVEGINGRGIIYDFLEDGAVVLCYRQVTFTRKQAGDILARSSRNG